VGVWIGFDWLGIGTFGWSVSHKRRGISWWNEWISASQNGFLCIALRCIVSPNKVRRDFSFSRRQVWSSESSGMYCRVVIEMSTDVSEVRAASIMRAITHRCLFCCPV
jgi:hypothetical protein